jgi:hypothetical protein
VEFALAQGGEDAGHGVVDAVEAGGSFRAYERALGGTVKAPRRALPLSVG